VFCLLLINPLLLLVVGILYNILSDFLDPAPPLVTAKTQANQGLNAVEQQRLFNQYYQHYV
jgi:hypothetical protein